jgi:hypothetical protein
VIVVEDDADMSRAVESVLNAAGFDAAMFPSAEALLEAQVPADTAVSRSRRAFALHEWLRAVRQTDCEASAMSRHIHDRV